MKNKKLKKLKQDSALNNPASPLISGIKNNIKNKNLSNGK
jgi:hypothetical protein